jgi:hypothetical protein
VHATLLGSDDDEHAVVLSCNPCGLREGGSAATVKLNLSLTPVTPTAISLSVKVQEGTGSTRNASSFIQLSKSTVVLSSANNTGGVCKARSLVNPLRVA